MTEQKHRKALADIKHWLTKIRSAKRQYEIKRETAMRKIAKILKDVEQ